MSLEERIAEAPEEAPASLFAPFGNQIFRSIWITNMLSNFGGMIQLTGAAWMMTSLSGSSNQVALVQTATALPIMLFSLVSGTIADHYHRRHIMLAANLFMLVVSAVLTAFAYFGALTPWQLLAFTFLVGCGAALNNPSWQASVSDMVPRSHLPSAVALNSVGFNLSRCLAPAIGGMILAAAGVIASFAVNTVSYVGLIGALLRWKPDYVPEQLPREPISRAMMAGIRYVVMSPNIVKIILRGFCYGVGAVAALALLPLVARDLVRGGPMDYGLMLGAFGLGGVAGAFLSNRLRARFHVETITRGAFLVAAACAGLVALSSSRWLACAGLLVSGICWVSALSLFNVTVQLSSPRWVLGRCLALYQTFVFSGLAGGGWLWGMTAETYGIRTALLLSGAVLAAGAAFGLRYPLPRHTALSLDPHNLWREPPLALDLKPSSGPIIITIEYRIKEENIPEFLRIADERRRSRVRSGAKRWSLMRDLQEPERWTISFQYPTWVDFVRHQSRSTHADLDLANQMSALHAGPEKPRVTRLIERQTKKSYPVQNPVIP